MSGASGDWSALLVLLAVLLTPFLPLAGLLQSLDYLPLQSLSECASGVEGPTLGLWSTTRLSITACQREFCARDDMCTAPLAVSEVGSPGQLHGLPRMVPIHCNQQNIEALPSTMETSWTRSVKMRIVPPQPGPQSLMLNHRI
ncbi:unnamed protein product [Arctogadus glacialis]